MSVIALRDLLFLFGLRQHSPPPVTDMPATFNLELVPGQVVALETTVASAEDVDMARMEDGTVVDGTFWGKLTIVHADDKHTVDFTGTRTNNPDVNPEFMFDSKAMSKLTSAIRPSPAKCNLSILAPAQQYCDVVLTVNSFWTLGMAWPRAERVEERKFKYFLRVHPGGALEHFDSERVMTSLYYEALSGFALSHLLSPKLTSLIFSDLILRWSILMNS